MEDHARRAQERANRISDRTDYKELEKCAQRALNEPLLSHRVFWLHKMADELGKATKGNSPCDNGCSFCCHQPVMITQLEARYIGRKLGILPKIPTYTIEPNPAYIGTPCPFLKDGKCSIYEHRPFACRVLYSVDDGPEPCEITLPYDPGRVAQLDNEQFYRVAVTALNDQIMYMADIRDFFVRVSEK